MANSQKLAPMATRFVVDHTVPASHRDDFLAVEKRLEDAVREASGCLDVTLEETPSSDPSVLHYRTTMDFASQDALLAWVDSERRQELVHEARDAFQYDYSLKSRLRGFDAWFPPPAGPPPPPSWKMNLLVLLTLYPTVLALAPLLRPFTKGLDFASGMLIGNAFSVSITGWVLIPLANKLYGPWLRAPHSPKVEWLGTLSALLGLALVWLLCRG